MFTQKTQGGDMVENLNLVIEPDAKMSMFNGLDE